MSDTEQETEREYADLNIGELLETYEKQLNTIDELDRQLKIQKQRKDKLQQEVMQRCQEQGVERLVGKSISVSITEKPVVRIEGDWQEVVSTLTQQGMSHLIQRRITASRLQEEMDAGMRLPDGVSIETVRNVSHRRMK